MFEEVLDEDEGIVVATEEMIEATDVGLVLADDELVAVFVLVFPAQLANALAPTQAKSTGTTIPMMSSSLLCFFGFCGGGYPYGCCCDHCGLGVYGCCHCPCCGG